MWKSNINSYKSSNNFRWNSINVKWDFNVWNSSQNITDNSNYYNIDMKDNVFIEKLSKYIYEKHWKKSWLSIWIIGIISWLWLIITFIKDAIEVHKFLVTKEMWNIMYGILSWIFLNIYFYLLLIWFLLIVWWVFI